MKLRKFFCLLVMAFFISNALIFTIADFNSFDLVNSQKVSSSSLGYSGLINRIYNKKLEQYGNKGYFPQIYEPSIQATYYALYILNAIGKLEDVNTSVFTDYIMSFYSLNESIFIDSYVKRWLDANTNRRVVYPLSSLLQINSYAVLSLDILGSLHLIDKQKMVDFIWDCYNPVTGGFTGMPFDVNMPEYLKDPTGDNTFFAVQVIDVLDNWELYNIAKDKIASFLSSLQLTMSDPKWFGGFYNNWGNTSALMMIEPNLLSAYYCIKTLEVIEKLDAINVDNFHSYLNNLYEPNSCSFYFSGFQSHTSDNELNIVGTALALELAELTSFSGHEHGDGIAFLLSNKNMWGIWDQSTDIHYHELIDTFQIMRSLKNMGVILVESEKNMIVSAMHNYFKLGGYTLLSEDYTSLRLITYLIKSYDIFNRLSDLPVSQLYLALESCYTLDSNFRGSINMYLSAPVFRSFPLEYFSIGNQKFIYGIERMTSQKNTFLAIDALATLSRLSLFEFSYSLSNIITTILDCQFLEENYTNYGGFLPNPLFKITANPSAQNSCVDFIDSYYAIRTLEILTSYNQYQNVTNFAVNFNALNSYLINQLHEEADELYCTPRNIENVELILEYTYYTVYILKAIGTYDLNNIKIKNFVLHNLNYNNLKNVYFSYQLSNLLNLSIYFDIPSIQALITNVYDSSLHEFYESTERIAIMQEGFYWVCNLEKYFMNPDYNDIIFFRDFSGEFIHTIILGGLLIGIPGLTIVITSKKIRLINFTQNFRKKLNL